MSNNAEFLIQQRWMTPGNTLTEASEDEENGEHCATWLGDVAKRIAPMQGWFSQPITTKQFPTGKF